MVCHILYLDLDVDFTSDAFVDTVDGEPTTTALTVFFEKQRAQIHLNEPKIRLAIFAHFDLEALHLYHLVFEHHLEPEKRVGDLPLPYRRVQHWQMELWLILGLPRWKVEPLAAAAIVLETGLEIVRLLDLVAKFQLTVHFQFFLLFVVGRYFSL